MITRFKDCATEVNGMSTKIENVSRNPKIWVLIGGLIAILASSLALAETGSSDAGAVVEKRTSISLHKVRGGRDKPTEVLESTEDYDALITAGEQRKTSTRSGLSKPGVNGIVSQSASFDFWFYEADVILYNDDDNDGFYYGIDLLFDVDTNFAAADIYAVMYLSYEGGPWNEYAVTDYFTIFGSSGTDEYVIQTELMSGYPTGSYDLLIEVFDAYDSAFLASFGPSDTSELAYLPLEDYNRDEPVEVIVVHEHGGGAVDLWFVGILLLLIGFGEVRRKTAAARI